MFKILGIYDFASKLGKRQKSSKKYACATVHHLSSSQTCNNILYDKKSTHGPWTWKIHLRLNWTQRPSNEIEYGLDHITYFIISITFKAGMYLQPNCGNGVIGNVYLSAMRWKLPAPHCRNESCRYVWAQLLDLAPGRGTLHLASWSWATGFWLNFLSYNWV